MDYQSRCGKTPRLILNLAVPTLVYVPFGTLLWIAYGWRSAASVGGGIAVGLLLAVCITRVRSLVANRK